MAPAPSPNAVGLAAYRQLAGNLRVTGIDHPYWTSRKGNSLRYALWAERRKHAGPYLREIAPRFPERERSLLLKAATEFEKEAGYLAKLAERFPVGSAESGHWGEDNEMQAMELLALAEMNFAEGVNWLAVVAQVDFSPFETKDADALEKLVTSDDILTSEAALAALAKLAPKDLDVRLARLMTSEPDVKKMGADGPIHRHLLFALAKLDSDIATDAIGEAVFFAGESDAVKPAVSKWAAEIYWERRGAAGKNLWLKALDSEVPHVRAAGLKYLGMCGDKAVLPKLAKCEEPAAYQARIRLGDDTAWAPLVAGLGTPAWYASYSLLRELGPAVEPHVFPYLEDDNQAIVVYVSALLSRVGTEKSLPLLEKTVAANPDIPRIAQALADLKKRLEEK